MTREVKTLYGMIATLIALLIIVSTLAALYFYEYNQAESANQAYVQELRQLDVRHLSNILIDYGNSTRIWYNNTSTEPGWNLYVTTQLITGGHINATYYPEYGSHFVTAIYNVANSGNEYWIVWTYNRTSSWQMALVGPDELPMFNGSIYAWSYCNSNCTTP